MQVSELEVLRVAVDGRATTVITAGKGPPLVFTHGGGILEGFDCFTPLARDHRFIAPQMPGFNGTELDPAPRSVADVVAHTAQVLDVLDVPSCVLVGHSLGGWVAATFAATCPGRVSRLVLAAPFGMDVPEHRGPRPDTLTRDEFYAALTNDPNVFAGKLPAGPDAGFDAARALELRATSGFIPGPFDPALPSHLARLEMPVLLQWGDDDRILPVGQLDAWKRALPAARSIVYPGVGHLLFHEAPDAVMDVASFAS